MHATVIAWIGGNGYLPSEYTRSYTSECVVDHECYVTARTTREVLFADMGAYLAIGDSDSAPGAVTAA